MPSSREIDEVRDWAADLAANGKSKFLGMTYEEGVMQAIDWIQGDSDERPDAE